MVTVWNRDNLELGSGDGRLGSQRFHDPDELQVVPWDAQAEPIQARILGSRPTDSALRDVRLLERIGLTQLSQ